MRLDNLLGGLLDAFTGRNQRRDRYSDEPYEEVQPASRDPFGDPADGTGRGMPQGGRGAFGDVADDRDVRPASEDPFGDPADEMGEERVLPSSRDPFGDPADRY